MNLANPDDETVDGIFSNEELTSELGLDMTEILVVENSLNLAMSNMWSEEAFKTHLSSEIEVDLNEEQKNVFLRFWIDNKENKIRPLLAQSSRWNNHFKSFSWRVDMKSLSKASVAKKNKEEKGESEGESTETSEDVGNDNVDGVNMPVSFFELATKRGHTNNFSDTNNGGNIRFEMTQPEVEDFVLQLASIQKSIEDASS